MIEMVRQQLIVAYQKLIQILTMQASEILRMKIHAVAKACIGQDVSPIQDEFGCAESVNTIVDRATGKPVGGQYSTWWMYEALKKSKNWKEVSEAEALPGDIIISPTGYGDKSKVANGHVGIFDVDGWIMSNESKDSLWKRNFTLASWKSRWGNADYLIKIYRIIKI
jgi:hypothetical protein